jgi:hypothetical protein
LVFVSLFYACYLFLFVILFVHLNVICFTCNIQKNKNMKKIVKILSYSFVLFVLIILGIVIYIKNFMPNVGEAEELVIERTQERLTRGTYLAHHVMLCMDCHAQRDWSVFSGPPIPGSEGSGGEVFNQDFGFPGSFHARNLTPDAIGHWTDGELFRAITAGVSKDGHALFPVMPYLNYGKMDEEDIKSVIVYIRSLNPISNQLPDSKPDFPMSLIINTLPQKPSFAKMPNKSDKIAYGAYLLNAAACNDCHTKQEKGKVVGEYLAGGFEFKFPDGSILRSPNITMHSSGIGGWTSPYFVQRFKSFDPQSHALPVVSDNGFQTVMPWSMYAGMEPEDLEAIFAYLQSVEPVNNLVERFSPRS